MKIETIALLGIAAYAGYHVAKKKLSTTTPAPVKTALTTDPTVIERVYVEEYPYYDYGWGWPYPVFVGGGWGGRRHHGHGHHGGHGGHHRGGGGRGGGRGGRR